MEAIVPWQDPALALALGYLLGSIPVGMILTRLTGAGDLRTLGSGSTGATNVLRTGRKGLAAATLILDLLKGVTAVLAVRLIDADLAPLAAVAAVVGHCYPIWLRFRGGKGVATLMGVTVALSWIAGLVFAAVWVGTVAATRLSSLGGLLAAISVPLSFALIPMWSEVAAGLFLALLVLWRHRANISRLMDGTEPRVGASARPVESPAA